MAKFIELDADYDQHLTLLNVESIRSISLEESVNHEKKFYVCIETMDGRSYSTFPMLGTTALETLRFMHKQTQEGYTNG